MRKVIGVTGGIASGKSNVISIIKRQGFKVIDCDLINHNLQKINMPIQQARLNNH